MLYDALGAFWSLVPKCIDNSLIEPYASYGWGGGPEDVDTFGVLETINPKFDPHKNKTWKLFEA